MCTMTVSSEQQMTLTGEGKYAKGLYVRGVTLMHMLCVTLHEVQNYNIYIGCVMYISFYINYNHHHSTLLHYYFCHHL